jgi:hypothetical protein
MSETASTQKKRPPFQVEPTDLVDEIMARGHITPWELFKIVSWKSAKGVAWLSLNTEEEIEVVTHETVDALKGWRGHQDVISAKMTFEDWDSWQADVAQIIGADKSRTKDGNSTGLLRLHGVGYPVATAILALLKPKIFPVMDRWAVETIFEEGSSRKQWQRSAVYRAYAERLVNPDCPTLERFTTLRERDKAAMNASMLAGEPSMALLGYESISFS